ncbi:MAG TPA: AAA family ATPase [Candidatus Cottocaccamicrobium excrementipullorum]|nr:AAA family ATPase [Candidatus Cottocaccamicrobium excrementipullorum]
MNIKRAKEEIKDTIEAYLCQDEAGEYMIPTVRQRPVLLIGPPGVGKTQIMEQVARECRIGLVAYTITHHTRQSAIGLPFIEKKCYGGKEYSVTEYTMSEIVASIYNKIEETGLKEGILFIDEINCVSETLAPAMLQFLQCKTFGTHQIPEGWIIVAAGNPPEYNKSVREFDVVTLDRIKLIQVEPDFEVWKEYAYREEIHPAVISYLNIKKQYLCQIETTVDGKLFATPRGWEDLSRLIQVYEKLGKKADREVIGEYIQHPKISKDFANYLELYDKYKNDYQVDEILSGVIREELCDKAARAPFDERLSMVGLLLSRLSSQFSQVLLEEKAMEKLTGLLKGLQPAEDEGEKQQVSLAFRLSELAKQLEEEEHELKRQELLTRREAVVYRRTAKLLVDCETQMSRWEHEEGSGQDVQAGWEALREIFAQDSDKFEALFQKSAQMLEYGFDFMEAAFGDGQEMVIFLTELNGNAFCAGFLKEYDCERYYEYNKRLLFDEEEKDILSSLWPENHN